VSPRLLALGPMCVFLCSAVSEWRVCGLSFLGSITFGASYEFLGRDLRISLLRCWAAATEPSGRQTGWGLYD